MIETEINISSCNSDQLERCRRQARFYARLANIALDEITLDEYVEARLSPNTNDTPLPSNQRLLFPMLDPEQQLMFRNTFEHIDFDN